MKHKYKAGDIAIVSDKKNGHQFNIGDVVEIEKYFSIANDYRAVDGNDFWYLADEELIPTGMSVNKPKKRNERV